jgi:toxin ParE1/3/4
VTPTSYKVVFHPAAQQELYELYDFIAERAGYAIASNFISGIREFCVEMSTFPQRGSSRDDISPGLRVVGYKRRVSIAFTVLEPVVLVLGIFYGGRNITFDLLDDRIE